MKTGTVLHFVPVKDHFSHEQMARIRQSWLEHWGFLADTEEEMSDEEILNEAKNLGLIKLPSGWKA
jgi:hypothetical protein